MNKWILDTPLLASVNGLTSGENHKLNKQFLNKRNSSLNESKDKFRKS